MKKTCLIIVLLIFSSIALAQSNPEQVVDIDQPQSGSVDVQDYIDNPDLKIPKPKEVKTETPRTRTGRAPAFWSGGKFPEFKTKEPPQKEIKPTSSGYKDTWIGRSANRPDTPPEEVEKAKTEVEEVFEGEYMFPPKEKLVERYSATVKLVRDGKTIPAFEARAYIREWIRSDRKRKEKEVMYSLPTYRMEGDSVRVKSTRVESNPRKIINVSVLFGKTVGTEWRILEDIWDSQEGKK